MLFKEYAIHAYLTGHLKIGQGQYSVVFTSIVSGVALLRIRNLNKETAKVTFTFTWLFIIPKSSQVHLIWREENSSRKPQS